MHTIICNNAGAVITVTLPTPVGRLGRIYIIKRDLGSTGTVAITAGGAQIQAINGTFAATTTLAALGAYGQHVQFQSDNINWHRIS
jgi:hypothetical protein